MKTSDMKKTLKITVAFLLAILLLLTEITNAQTPAGPCSPATNQLANPQITNATPNLNMIVGVPVKVPFRFANAGDDPIPANTINIRISLGSDEDFEFVAPYISNACGVWTVIPSETGTDVISLINSGGPTADGNACDIEIWVKAKRAGVTNTYSVNVNRYAISASCVGDADASAANNTKAEALFAYIGPAPDINNTYVNVPVDGNVSTNDKNPPGTTYGTPVLTGSPSGSAPNLTFNPDGSYSFTGNVPGVYTYNVPVCSPSYPTYPDECINSTLTITVTGITPASTNPVANTDIASTNESTPVVIKTLANDNSMDPAYPLQPSTVSVITLPANGTTSINATTGDITYTPNTGFYGRDTLYYKVCDNNATPKCATAMQIITVLPPSVPGQDNTILAADDYSRTTKNMTATGNAKNNDTNPESGQTSTVVAETKTVAGKGTFTIDANGDYSFVPDPAFTGAINFPYEICDNGSPVACAKATVYITVNDPAANTTLPIGIQLFKASWFNNWGKLTWKGTGIETTGTYYGVERSVDGISYQSIGRVDAIANGTEADYQFIDKDVEAASYNNKVIYYRLKLVDNDGSFKYSEVRYITKSGQNLVSLYPNPAKENIRFTNLKDVTALEIRSMAGQLVLQVAKVNPSQLDYNISNLSSGTYIVTLRMEDSQTQHIKLVVQK